jgi:hypothetical protein
MLIPVEELTEKRSAVAEGLLAVPTYQAAAGIDDPDAENVLIAERGSEERNGNAS